MIRIQISDVYHDGSTICDGCARRVRYNEREDTLFVDIGIVGTGEEIALTVAQRIHYEFSAEMINGFPSRTELRHRIHDDDVQFSMTSEYDCSGSVFAKERSRSVHDRARNCFDVELRDEFHR